MVYTHGHHTSVLRSHSSRTIANSAAYLEPHLRPGMRILDVGSGPGTITAGFAQRVTPGEVVAMEINEAAAQVTRAELAAREVTNARVVIGDVHNLAFADGEFDVVHGHQVLQHVRDPVRALAEMARVTRPGGLVAARDSDYGRFDWQPRLPALDEWMRFYREAAYANGGEPDAGRHLGRWAEEAGFTRVEVSESVWRFATAAERQWWGDMWAERILASDLARQLVAEERATRAELEEISAAWRVWAADPQAWISIPHGEVLVTV